MVGCLDNAGLTSNVNQSGDNFTGGNMSEIFWPLITGLLCIGMAFLALVGVIVLLPDGQDENRLIGYLKSASTAR
jgi:hypothetical protein